MQRKELGQSLNRMGLVLAPAEKEGEMQLQVWQSCRDRERLAFSSGTRVLRAGRGRTGTFSWLPFSQSLECLISSLKKH